MRDSPSASKEWSPGKAWWPTQPEWDRRQRTVNLGIKTTTGFWNTWFRQSRTTISLRSASRRGGIWTNLSRKQAKGRTSTSRWRTWRTSTRSLEYINTYTEIKEATEEAVEDTWDKPRDHKINSIEGMTTNKRWGEMRKPVTTVGRQMHINLARTVQHTGNNVWNVENTTTSPYVAKEDKNCRISRDLTTDSQEGYTRDMWGELWTQRRQAANQTTTTSIRQQSMWHTIKRVRSGENQDTVPIRIGDIDDNVEPDSEVSVNIMDEYQFKTLQHRSQEVTELQLSQDTLKTLQSNLVAKGEFPVTLRNMNRGTKSRFLVIQGKMDSPPLLCKKTLLELGMLKIEPKGTLKETNELRIKAVKPADDNLEALLNEFSEVFEGIGCLRDKLTGERNRGKARNGPRNHPHSTETATCGIPPTETTEAMAWAGSWAEDLRESSRWRTNHMVFTTSRAAQTQVHQCGEGEAWTTDDQSEHRHENPKQVNEAQPMCPSTESGGLHLPLAWLQDIYEAGP